MLRICARNGARAITLNVACACNVFVCPACSLRAVFHLQHLEWLASQPLVAPLPPLVVAGQCHFCALWTSSP
eukprot:6107024-Alexandrium_andersonii.AAC.1